MLLLNFAYHHCLTLSLLDELSMYRGNSKGSFLDQQRVYTFRDSSCKMTDSSLFSTKDNQQLNCVRSQWDGLFSMRKLKSWFTVKLLLFDQILTNGFTNVFSEQLFSASGMAKYLSIMARCFELQMKNVLLEYTLCTIILCDQL